MHVFLRCHWHSWVLVLKSRKALGMSRGQCPMHGRQCMYTSMLAMPATTLALPYLTHTQYTRTRTVIENRPTHDALTHWPIAVQKRLTRPRFRTNFIQLASFNPTSWLR